jgi:cyclopropane-fatty-acyl-phospholipid synthase
MSNDQLIYDLLSNIREGRLAIRDPRGKMHVFGSEGSTPDVRIVVHDQDIYSRILRNPDLGLGESYVDGWWDAESGSIVDVMALIFKNNLKDEIRGDLRTLGRVLYNSLRSLPTLSRSLRNVRHHYDVGNEFFELFLDPSMTYSCGYQLHPDDSLYQMQLQKYDMICRKLDLQPGDRVIDVGCGWGGMLLYAGKKYGVTGLGITLSSQQESWARKRIADEGLGGRLEIRLQDYRAVEEKFDKFVSIGMFEHVGGRYYPTFMRKVCQLLRHGGRGLLHTIGTTGRQQPGDWLSRYIFPGSYWPRLGDLTEEMRKVSFTVGHIENWKLHYAETARHWSDNFRANRQRILGLGGRYDERFLRMWDYYLQLAEGAFRYDTLQLYQVLFNKGSHWNLPLRFDFHNPAGTEATAA